MAHAVHLIRPVQCGNVYPRGKADGPSNVGVLYHTSMCVIDCRNPNRSSFTPDSDVLLVVVDSYDSYIGSSSGLSSAYSSRIL
jgi:hypothetical protein